MSEYPQKKQLSIMERVQRIREHLRRLDELPGGSEDDSITITTQMEPDSQLNSFLESRDSDLWRDWTDWDEWNQWDAWSDWSKAG